jgi:hypothetical protein
MLFGCNKVDGSSLVCSILIIVSRVDIACHTTSLYHSFSCRYSMSYDISISLLKKNFIKPFFSKSSRKGELIRKRKDGGQSNMTTSLHKSRSITHDHPISSAVPYKYSKP